MKMSHRRAWTWALAAALWGCGEAPRITIALAGPLSESRGISTRQGAELAVREINASGGLRGRAVELVTRDDQGDPDLAVAIATELAADPGVVAVVGHFTSSAALAAASVYGNAAEPLLNISPSASSARLSAAGPFTFRICPTDSVHGARLADWAFEGLGTSRAAIIYENDDYGRGLRDAFAREFETLGGTIADNAPYIDALPGFEPYLQRIRRRGADVLLFAGTESGARRLLRTRDSLGMTLPVVSGDGVAGIERDTPGAEGLYISTGYLSDASDPRNNQFVTAYRNAFRDELPDYRSAGAYDIMQLLGEAIEEVGVDRRRIREYLTTIGASRVSFDGVTGAIAFDERGDVPAKAVSVGVVRNRLLTSVQPR